MSPDVVVCGAGAGGLAAACALGRLGLRVTVLDKQPTHRPVPKGELLQPGAVRTLTEWGAAAHLERRGAVPISRLAIRGAAGESLLTLDYGRLPGEHRRILAHDYESILDALSARLGTGVEVRRGVRADDLVRSGDGRVTGVAVTEAGRRREIRADLVVAADGLSSRLRKAAGIAAGPRKYGHRLLTFELPGCDPATRDVSAHVTPGGLRLVYPLPGGRTRLYVQVAADEFRGDGTADLDGWCDRLLAEVPALAPLADGLRANLERRRLLSVWRFLAPRMALPGLALLGEAAHSVHPMMAQGMNCGIADAEVLARRLAGTGSTTPRAVDAALAGYEEERRPSLEHADRISHTATRMITDTSWRGLVLGRRMLRGTARNPRILHTTSYNMSGLGMRPLRLRDRLYQFGLLPDPAADRLPALT